MRTDSLSLELRAAHLARGADFAHVRGAAVASDGGDALAAVPDRMRVGNAASEARSTGDATEGTQRGPSRGSLLFLNRHPAARLVACSVSGVTMVASGRMREGMSARPLR